MNTDWQARRSRAAARRSLDPRRTAFSGPVGEASGGGREKSCIKSPPAGISKIEGDRGPTKERTWQPAK
jgi:hypothetical protein